MESLSKYPVTEPDLNRGSAEYKNSATNSTVILSALSLDANKSEHKIKEILTRLTAPYLRNSVLLNLIMLCHISTNTHEHTTYTNANFKTNCGKRVLKHLHYE